MADTAVSNGNGSSGVVDSAQPDINPRQAHLAFARKWPELLEVPDDLMPVINFDVIILTNSVLAAVPRIKSKRHLLEGVQPFSMRWVDDLEDYGLTLGHTQAVVRLAEESLSGEDLAFLLEQHESLIRDADSLNGRKLLDPVKVSNLPRNTTHSNVGHDVLAITNFFLSSWAQIAGRCPIPKDELELVRERANLYILATTRKGEQQTSLAEALLNRRRAAYLVLTAYRRIRSALMLVLDAKDKVNEIAPPLDRRRRTRRSSSASAPVAPPVDDSDDEDDESDESGEFELDAIGEDAPNAAAAPVKSTASAVRVGMPGSSPTQDNGE